MFQMNLKKILQYCQRIPQKQRLSKLFQQKQQFQKSNLWLQGYFKCCELINHGFFNLLFVFEERSNSKLQLQRILENLEQRQKNNRKQFFQNEFIKEIHIQPQKQSIFEHALSIKNLCAQLNKRNQHDLKYWLLLSENQIKSSLINLPEEAICPDRYFDTLIQKEQYFALLRENHSSCEGLQFNMVYRRLVRLKIRMTRNLSQEQRKNKRHQLRQRVSLEEIEIYQQQCLQNKIRLNGENENVRE